MHPLIPAPTHCEFHPGEFTLRPHTALTAIPAFRAEAAYLQARLRAATAWDFPAAEDAHITLEREETLPPEGYTLEITTERVRIAAATPVGAFYGVQTLLQLLPAAVYQGVPRRDFTWTLPALRIADSPRFTWRGVHLDSARHYQPPAFLRKFIDALAIHKINRLHWHLTEDQGWRIEIKRYPRLTEIGSQRRETVRGHLRQNLGGDGVPHGGFYTQEEVREIVAYAAERHITIVPEIEMPGHASAAISAYPELGCVDEPVEVATTWGIHKNLFNAEESTIEFLQNVLDEVMELFPSPYIHVGGDEAVKDQWKASAAVQKRITELGLADENALQTWFIGRMAEHLRARGRNLVCWEEVMEGGLPENTAIMSWLGTHRAIEAANSGFQAIMTPGKSLYFDHYQSADTRTEPLAIGGCVTLETVYAFDPLPEEIRPENRENILGVQGQLWTEYMPTTELVEYMGFPRVCALAELAWSAPEVRDYAGFRQRLGAHVRRLENLGIRYRGLEPL